MGRSVNYLNNARYITYLNFECEEDEIDWAWDDFKDSVIECFSSFKTLSPPSSKTWDNNETVIILENAHAEVGISEYCGCVSVSIRTNENDAPVKIGLAERWIDTIWPKVLNKLTESFPKDHLMRVGGFSDGTSVYQLRK
jgi:hypothetical protein